MGFYVVEGEQLDWEPMSDTRDAGTAQQIVNETDEILVFVYGAPPQRGPADVIESAV